MSGYDGTHQDWLEGQASDQLEREEYERSHFSDIGRSVVQGDGWEVIRTEHGQFSIYVDEPVDEQTAVRIANAILSEVEIAQRGGTDG